MSKTPVLVSLQDELASARPQQRAHTARLLKLLRQSRRGRRDAPALLHITDPHDRLHLALWSLGAFKRQAIPGAVWLNQSNGWPVVRRPDTLQYFTLDTREPLGVPRRFPYPRYSHLVAEDCVLTVQ